MNSKEHRFTNHLVRETSPYLLQHAHNPVNWYPWGKEALEKAGKENKLILVSIGYSACHWCHVMEHESFEDAEVAAYMNEHFVSVKVDREERPDIDQVYMNAVQLITGSGGWPLNCIALPDGRPVYGGTYFPRSQWLDMLSQVKDFVLKNPGKTEQQAYALTKGVQSGEEIFRNEKQINYSKTDLDEIFSAWKNNVDYVKGGYLGAPKFPLPVGFRFLLDYHFMTGNPDALRAVTTSLDNMSRGGIYDQAGGGFCRYSTDEDWKVPHFEKMLYDNAQLVSLYAMAYQLTHDQAYRDIVNETLGFISRELASPEGGFYSSLDADSEGEEGKYYVWTAEEVKKITGKHASLVSEYFNIKEPGNWENSVNILFRTGSDRDFALKHKLSEEELSEILTAAKKSLAKERAKRIRPGLDDKILASWNGLMLSAYAHAYRILGNDEYLETARKNAEFISTNLKSADHRLYRNYKNRKATINGFLDDYAFTISGFISLYQASFEEKWLNEARGLAEYTLAHFFDEKSGMFFYTSDLDPGLFARKMEVSDNVIPSSNSEMAKNLFTLGHYFYSREYISIADQMLRNVKENTLQAGTYYANWDILMTWFISEPFEVCIAGKDASSIRKQFDRYYLPNVFFSGGSTEGSLSLMENKLVTGQTTIYVCRDRECKLPVTGVKEALVQMNLQATR